MRIIGFVAPKSGGKDTAAAILIEGKKANGKLSFAGPLKEICSKVFGISLTILNDPVNKERPFKQPLVLTRKHLRDIKHECVSRLDPVNGTFIVYNPNKASTSGLENKTVASPRELMQVIGTDYIRQRIFGEWHLQAAFSPETLAKHAKNGVYCVTDIRFVNEYEYLKKRFGNDFQCYYVERPEAEEKLKEATHPSELETQKIKALLPESNIIRNDGSIDDLKKKLLAIKQIEEAKPKRGFKFKENDGK